MIESIYIHIPFCNKICSYCDFCKSLYNEELVNKYLDSLEYEICHNYKNEKIKTLYIGGGSPSSLTIEQLNKLFSILLAINLEQIEEYTIEVNIEDITEEKLKLFKENGINRLSIGVQTFNKDILKLMNREYSDDPIEKILLAKKYFSNISIDLIYGFKEQTLTQIKKDLDTIIALDIPHVSTYSLIIEEHTMLYINKYERINDDLDSEIYNYIINTLEKNGYIHYEISNFGKNGYFSKHNLCYWNNREYYGFGLGASGYIDNLRYTNTRNLNKYLEHNYIDYREYLTKRNKEEYEMILGLRKVEGVKKEDFFNKYNCNIADEFDIMNMLVKGLLKENKEFLYISKDKLYVENSILINFLGGSNEE